MRKRLAIFDFDGTLADSLDWFSGILDEVGRRHGLVAVPPAERERLRGRPTREILAAFAVPAWKLPLIARDMRALAVRDAGLIRPFPWVPAVLGALDAAGVRLAVVSSNGEPAVRAVLGPEVAGRIGLYATGAALFGKAAKFRRVLRWAGVSSAEAAAIGDEIRDVEAARAAGIDALAATWGFATEAALAGAGPTALLGRPEDLLAWFLPSAATA